MLESKKGKLGAARDGSEVGNVAVACYDKVDQCSGGLLHHHIQMFVL